MASAALELQGLIVGTLKAAGGVSAIVADRVFDQVPRSPATGAATAQFPFLSIGDFQEITEDADCIDGAEITVTVDAWSRTVGRPEVHRLAAAVKAALHNADLTLTENALVMLEHENTLTLTDPDGLTAHAIISFRAFVEQP